MCKHWSVLTILWVLEGACSPSQVGEDEQGKKDGGTEMMPPCETLALSVTSDYGDTRRLVRSAPAGNNIVAVRNTSGGGDAIAMAFDPACRELGQHTFPNSQLGPWYAETDHTGRGVLVGTLAGTSTYPFHLHRLDDEGRMVSSEQTMLATAVTSTKTDEYTVWVESKAHDGVWNEHTERIGRVEGARVVPWREYHHYPELCSQNIGIAVHGDTVALFKGVYNQEHNEDRLLLSLNGGDDNQINGGKDVVIFVGPGDRTCRNGSNFWGRMIWATERGFGLIWYLKVYPVPMYYEERSLTGEVLEQREFPLFTREVRRAPRGFITLAMNPPPQPEDIALVLLASDMTEIARSPNLGTLGIYAWSELELAMNRDHVVFANQTKEGQRVIFSCFRCAPKPIVIK